MHLDKNKKINQITRVIEQGLCAPDPTNLPAPTSTAAALPVPGNNPAVSESRAGVLRCQLPCCLLLVG